MMRKRKNDIIRTIKIRLNSVQADLPLYKRAVHCRDLSHSSRRILYMHMSTCPRLFTAA